MKTLLTILVFVFCSIASGQNLRAFYNQVTVKDTLWIKGVVMIDSGQKTDTTQVIMLASRCDDCKSKTVKGYHTATGYYDRKWRKIEFVWISKEYIWK